MVRVEQVRWLEVTVDDLGVVVVEREEPPRDLQGLYQYQYRGYRKRVRKRGRKGCSAVVGSRRQLWAVVGSRRQYTRVVYRATCVSYDCILRVY